ncbi:hypothetical protein GQ53DRAFT_450565 [Thozetella sp. PMI_491]|nr:hypothetical protein GQ53DRAFT_450565 [Thozetella sp. PMI_491]
MGSSTLKARMERGLKTGEFHTSRRELVEDGLVCELKAFCGVLARPVMGFLADVQAFGTGGCLCKRSQSGCATIAIGRGGGTIDNGGGMHGRGNALKSSRQKAWTKGNRRTHGGEKRGNGRKKWVDANVLSLLTTEGGYGQKKMGMVEGSRVSPRGRTGCTVLRHSPFLVAELTAVQGSRGPGGRLQVVSRRLRWGIDRFRCRGAVFHATRQPAYLRRTLSRGKPRGFKNG